MRLVNIAYVQWGNILKRGTIKKQLSYMINLHFHGEQKVISCATQYT